MIGDPLAEMTASKSPAVSPRSGPAQMASRHRTGLRTATGQFGYEL